MGIHILVCDQYPLTRSNALIRKGHCSRNRLDKTGPHRQENVMSRTSSPLAVTICLNHQQYSKLLELSQSFSSRTDVILEGSGFECSFSTLRVRRRATLRTLILTVRRFRHLWCVSRCTVTFSSPCRTPYTKLSCSLRIQTP
jgi:hypothetical protein